ncbi:MAG: SUMF1/EgtB/PvdO family nonheme iron enzyme, partial [Nitrospira sp.]|nr:SUMF1/EgtB/PvdO family nonheme iron enzyme [Nitrospira sp.]
WEWTADWYELRYYHASPSQNPQGPATGTEKVKRGGSWYTYHSIKTRASQPPENSDDQTGFRCAKSVK